MGFYNSYSLFPRTKELGVRLVVSSGYQNAIYATKLPMQALGAGLVLMPSAVVNESSDTLLFHDDRQIDKRMVRPFGFVEVQVQEFSSGGM